MSIPTVEHGADLEDLDAPDFGDDSIDLEDPDGDQSTDGGGWTRPAFTAVHIAAAVAAGLVVGFLGGKATTGAPALAPAAVVSSPSPASGQASTPATPTLPPYNAGTTYPAPPSPSATAAASVPTYSPGDLATGDPLKAPHAPVGGRPNGRPLKATAAADPLLAGYSTRISPQYIKMLCLPVDKGPDACLRAWETSAWGAIYPNGYKP